MKSLFAFAFVLVSSFAASPSFAEPKSYTFSYSEPMSAAECTDRIQNFAMESGFTLEMWGENDYYLMGHGGLSGNAYYSEGICHIYVR